MSVKKMTTSEFNKAIQQDGVQLFRFWAPWCPPCMMMKPFYRDAEQRVGKAALFAEVNIDEQQALAARHGIRSIPTLVVYKNGKEVQRMSGVMSSKDIAALAEKHR
ncbi:thioredoxin family protein [Pokkaliibacter sp. CJK22405]|uniref:thioredoxin family protein n=1 Tax=Pokkaliibacter sp. CJK22405 TaxID=3384615 RepID=UPI003984DF7A